MSDKTQLDLIEEAILDSEVSDDVLEAAAGKAEAASFTLGSCTGFYSCPAN
jgi:hypothetical protein